MSRKLGEILIDAGKITEAQLHRALTAQLVFGGHLGTSLLELGCIDEEALGESLAESCGIPYADFDMLSRVPYSVIRALPAKLVEKHKVVPLRLEGKTLHIAMIDPRNLLAIDEISFVTGYRIVAWVSPEVRILQVLEKYYNLPRTQRYSTLTRELSRLTTRRQKLRPLQTEGVYIDPDARPDAYAAPAAAQGADLVDTAESPAVAMAAVASSSSASSSSSAGKAETMGNHWEKYGYGRSWRDLAEALEAESLRAEVPVEEADTKPQLQTPPAPAPVREAGPAVPSLPEIAWRLAAAESVEEIVTSTLAYLSARLARSIFFVVRGERIIAWSGQGDGISPQRIKDLSFAQGAGPALFVPAAAEAADGASCFLGAVPPSPATAQFYELLGLPTPRTVIVVPIIVKGRAAAYLYGDGAQREILAIDLPAILSLCTRAGFALQILILRNKILAA